MTYSSMNDAKHWHDRAAEIRVLVEQMKVIEWRLTAIAVALWA